MYRTGRIDLDLRTGRLAPLEGVPLYGRGALWWAAQGDPGPPTIPAGLAGPAVLAAATRLADRSTVVLRKEGALIVMYRWHEGREPGAPTGLYEVPSGRDVQQTAVSTDGIVLSDCAPGGAECVYVLFSIDGKKLTVSTRSRSRVIGMPARCR